MSRTQTLTLLPVALVAALTGALASRGARAQEGTGDHPASAPVSKPAPWEYRVFLMDYTEYSEKDEWKGFYAQAGGNALKADSEFRSLHVLNWLAHDGWELVQIVQIKEKLGYLYLRRPRTSDALPVAPTADGTLLQQPKDFPNPDPHPRRPAPH